ncbi:hypothetical protein MIND_00198800 [Mycena indigotica]|uniref:Uncharacterized protein n=1 Tax=Mycena indigotica TaxID=2126181 RepID=A0A8H6WAS3_9AGAR|nr:uncharacterized protein MIND_00198800 [Mycena indigotica]KAF7311879.1 hypothetical protein MIND_00198800 [Mycena indigotica]
MPPSRADLPPEHFESHPSDAKLLRCLLSYSYDVGRKDFIQKSNVKRHVATAAHQSCVKRAAERTREELVAQTRTDLTYQGSEAVYPATAVPFPHRIPVPPMFPAVTKPLLDHEMSEFRFVAQEPAQRDTSAREFQRILADALQYDNGDQPLEDNDEEDFEPELTEEDAEILESEPLCFPYPNRTVLMLDAVNNFGRCRFTNAQMSLVLHLLKHLGARDVPTLKGLRKIQKQVHDQFPDKPVKITSSLGNIFYMNDIRHAIARDFSNPLVAPHLHLYPEEMPRTGISERWQAARLFEYTAEELTPMYSNGRRRWWINELAQLQNGQFVIPMT